MRKPMRILRNRFCGIVCVRHLGDAGTNDVPLFLPCGRVAKCKVRGTIKSDKER